MNNKDQENGAWRGPLIFTVPAYGFVMALYVDWLGLSTEQLSAPKTRGWTYLGNSAKNSESLCGHKVLSLLLTYLRRGLGTPASA